MQALRVDWVINKFKAFVERYRTLTNAHQSELRRHRYAMKYLKEYFYNIHTYLASHGMTHTTYLQNMPTEPQQWQYDAHAYMNELTMCISQVPDMLDDVEMYFKAIEDPCKPVGDIKIKSGIADSLKIGYILWHMYPKYDEWATSKNTNEKTTYLNISSDLHRVGMYYTEAWKFASDIEGFQQQFRDKYDVLAAFVGMYCKAKVDEPKKCVKTTEKKEKTTPDKPKKTRIPAVLKTHVWNKYIGEDLGKAKCTCCKLSDITQRSFHCGHVISEASGGSTSLDNLRPVCSSCNLSMGTMNMDEFIAKHKF